MLVDCFHFILFDVLVVQLCVRASCLFSSKGILKHPNTIQIFTQWNYASPFILFFSNTVKQLSLHDMLDDSFTLFSLVFLAYSTRSQKSFFFFFQKSYNYTMTGSCFTDRSESPTGAETFFFKKKRSVLVFCLKAG